MAPSITPGIREAARAIRVDELALASKSQHVSNTGSNSARAFVPAGIRRSFWCFSNRSRTSAWSCTEKIHL